MLPLLSLPVSHQDAALAHVDTLPPYDLVIRTDSFVPFPFGKGGSGVLVHFVALRSLFCFRQAQCVQVFH